MNLLSGLGRRRFELPCTVEIENTPESLHAHVEIDGDFVVEPGDEVQVIDAPGLPPLRRPHRRAAHRDRHPRRHAVERLLDQTARQSRTHRTLRRQFH